MSHQKPASCALLLGMLALGCGSNGQSPSSDRPRQPPAASSASAGPALIGRDTLARCAGFGVVNAAEILGVPASAVVDKSQDITPNSRGCGFAHGEDGSKALLFSVYSAFNSLTGSNLSARRAGMSAAATLTMSITTAAKPNVPVS